MQGFSGVLGSRVLKHEIRLGILGVSENRGPKFTTLNSGILSIRTPKQGTPNFLQLPY